MNYLKINGIDFSKYVNALKINSNNIYNAQTNAAGDTVVDYINSKRQIEVGIIALNANAMVELQTIINRFNVTLSFLNPNTGEIENNVKCILPANEVEFYTIQTNNISYKAFTLIFVEL